MREMRYKQHKQEEKERKKTQHLPQEPVVVGLLEHHAAHRVHLLEADEEGLHARPILWVPFVRLVLDAQLGPVER
jgi:hypothetical protein